MKHQPIKVSVLLTTHIPQHHFFRLLNSLQDSDYSGMEMIIIDDAAQAEFSGKIHDQVESFQNDRIVLLDHEHSTGRGNCLNEALHQATGTFLWAPEQADRFNSRLFREALNRFSTDPAAVWVMDYNLPSSSTLWLEDALDGRLPDDSCFVWNRNVLEGRSLFYNPFLTHLHGAELAMRVQESHVWHRTDPFFVIDENQWLAPVGLNLEEFYRSAHRIEQDSSQKEVILEGLKTAGQEKPTDPNSGDLLTRCRQLLAQDDAKTTFELINTFLKKEPRHREAIQIKVTALEKMRRHVEAAELKHSLKHLKDSEAPKPDSKHAEPVQIPVDKSHHKENEDSDTTDKELKEPEDETKQIAQSVVIPTTGIGKPYLERCISSLSNVASAEITELIVIDNASIDDTFDYLQQLEQKQFMNIRVVTNPSNAGFAASVNQGLETASGKVVLVAHNDVEFSNGIFEHLRKGFEQDENIAVVAPLLNETEQAAQRSGKDEEDPFLLTDQVDSCCFMVRRDLPVSMSEAYGLAYFEMDDFCSEIRDQGGLIAVSTSVAVTHHAGATTGAMGLRLSPQRKWINRAAYNAKWNKQPVYTVPNQGTIADRLERLEPPTDPSDPPEEWKDEVNEFLTDEVKTKIMRSDLSRRELLVIVPTLLMADCRELLRNLEDRLDKIDLPPSLLMLFIHFYYEKNIYSRCRHYLEKAENSHPAFDMYRLKIFVDDKQTNEASELLGQLMEEYPASPDLFALAAKLYEHAGDKDESKSFAAMANQLDPVSYPPEESEFEVKF